jgi:2-octaprenylphenol hydroxylase
MSRARIVVSGGGPVGLAFACACSGADVRVIEAQAGPRAPSGEFDVRVYALSAGTRAFLRDLGAWEQMDARRIAAVRRMEVFGDRGARLSFSGRAGAPLAWIVEAGRLSEALETLAASHGHVTVSRGARAAEFGAMGAGAWARLESGERIEADLLVGADGPDSPVRKAFGFAAGEEAYGEAALVANFETEVAHGEIARQWFRADGVLAWLPLPGKRISIVWSAPLAHADEIAALDERAFERRVREAGGAVLGDLKLISSIGRFPLRLIRIANPVVEAVALIGDAAHAVHPLAGQGVNLGFQDARVLAETLAERTPLERAGDLRVLRRYARARREDVSAMQFVTDRLDQLFAADTAGVPFLRNAGLRMVQSQPWIKGILSGRAMR